MKKLVLVVVALAMALSVVPAMAGDKSVSGTAPAMFRALSKLPAGERAVSSLTDEQLASIEGARRWSEGVVIEQLTKGGGTNIALVRQQNGESAVVEQQSGGKSTTEAVRVPEQARVLLRGPLPGRVGAIVEQLLAAQERRKGAAPMHAQQALAVAQMVQQLLISQGPFAGAQILSPLRNGGALGRRGGP